MDKIIDLVEGCSSRLGGALNVSTIRPIGSLASKERVADATQVLLVDGKSKEDDCVLILSNPRFPDAVDQAVIKALDAQSSLGIPLGRAVCTPLLTGRWNGQSYAVYQRLEGFSKNKYFRRFQVLSSGPKILDWLSGVFQKTRIECFVGEERDRDFLMPLRALSCDESLDDLVRKSAASLEGQVCRGENRTFKCLEHGDFWHDNVMFFRAPFAALSPAYKDFQIIDWGGSRLNGYPGIDVLRFSTSAFGQGAAASKRIRLFCESVGMSRVEFSLSCFCALGWLASNLNQFPKNKFNDLASGLASFLQRHEFLHVK